jgi:hypothetical protein
MDSLPHLNAALPEVDVLDAQPADLPGSKAR